jgi:hypothetical protein
VIPARVTIEMMLKMATKTTREELSMTINRLKKYAAAAICSVSLLALGTATASADQEGMSGMSGMGGMSGMSGMGGMSGMSGMGGMSGWTPPKK